MCLLTSGMPEGARHIHREMTDITLDLYDICALLEQQLETNQDSLQHLQGHWKFMLWHWTLHLHCPYSHSTQVNTCKLVPKVSYVNLKENPILCVRHRQWKIMTLAQLEYGIDKGLTLTLLKERKIKAGKNFLNMCMSLGWQCSLVPCLVCGVELSY